MPHAFDPHWVVRPGEILAEELGELHVTPRVAAVAMHLPLETVQGVLDGSVPITDEVAAGIVRLIPTSKRLWLNLERAYRDGLAAGKTEIR